MEEIAQSVMKTLNLFKESERGIELKPYDPIEIMNQARGDLKGVTCEKCRDKGVIYYMDGIYECCKPCDCMEVRNSIRRIERSGLKNAFKKCGFDNFITEKPFQKDMKEKAGIYVSQNQCGKWFFVGGQVGCGKTHICTAIVRKLMTNYQKPALYMQWRDEIGKIKAHANDEEYQKIITPWKKIAVLYIDDLFKTEVGKQPTTADINVAFEIINYRYNNPNLITIISSERTLKGLVMIDEAVGSRIAEMSRGFCISIEPDMKKNYRLMGIS